ncbi:ABC transporter ATP-binding protein [Niallia circulans]|uniref:ABC transporter ATP-binding protein n=1 Tax=Niallia circulans TaxID=1397 RepID=UPI000F44D0F9|nr:ABC transporter ATP-binding protein [Niallia circulans]AYV70046.1 ABC transporter ATP-binding protein [Niallia circulans]
MSKIFGRLRVYKLSITIALILMLTELVVELVQPLIMAKIIDDGLAHQDTKVVLIWGGLLILFSLVAFAAGIINTLYSSHVCQNFGYSLRNELYQIIQYFTFSSSNVFASSSLITRLTNDITQLQNTIFMGLRFLLRAPLLIVGGIIMSFLVNVKLAFILAITIPLIVVMFIWVIKVGRSLFQSVQKKLDQVNSVMLENLTAVRLIRAYIRKQFERNRFMHTSEDLKKLTQKALRIMETTVPLLLFAMNLCIIAILWIGSGQINTGEAQIGEVVAVINYTLRITTSISVVSMLVMVISRSKASADRIQEIIDKKEQDKDNPDESMDSKIKGKIKFQHVSFRYPSNRRNTIENLHFTIHSKETIAILGATGSGKTTLFQLIPRLYEPTEGSVLIDDKRVNSYSLYTLRKQIGYVPQESMLFTGTIQENIRWGNPDATFDEVVQAAKDAQIHDTIMLMPNTYDTRIGQKGVNLSGGQKQRLSIARALVRKPSILLLDDSTSALDLKTEKKLLDAVADYQCTLLLITQKVSTAMKADRIMLIEDGKIVSFASHDELWKTNNLYQKIVESQLGEGEWENAKGTNRSISLS